MNNMANSKMAFYPFDESRKAIENYFERFSVFSDNHELKTE